MDTETDDKEDVLEETNVVSIETGKPYSPPSVPEDGQPSADADVAAMLNYIGGQNDRGMVRGIVVIWWNPKSAAYERATILPAGDKLANYALSFCGALELLREDLLAQVDGSSDYFGDPDALDDGEFD